MKLRRIRPPLYVILVGIAAAIGLPAADAKPILYTRWISTGSSGDPGGVTYTLVVDGWGDDGTSGLPNGGRFPNGGRGGGGKKISLDGKVDFPGTPGKGCVIPPNYLRALSLPPGTETWQVYLSPKLNAVDGVAFTRAIDQINESQRPYGHNFTLVYVADPKQARITVEYALAMKAGDVGQTYLEIDRAGQIQSSLTLLPPSIGLPNPDFAFTRAVHELSHGLGLGHTPEPQDPNYPSAMATYDDKENWGLGVDPCMAARIDANVNRK